MEVTGLIVRKFSYVPVWDQVTGQHYKFGLGKVGVFVYVEPTRTVIGPELNPVQVVLSLQMEDVQLSDCEKAPT